MKTNEKSSSLLLIKRLWKEHISPYKKYFAASLVCMSFAAVATAALSWLLQPIFDKVFTNGTTDALVIFCSAIFITFLVKGVSSFGEAVLMNYVGQKIICDLQERLFKHLLYADLSYFHKSSTGSLISHFTNDINLMRSAVSHTIVGIGKDSLTLICLVTLMFFQDFYLACAAFIVFPTAVIPIATIGRRLRKVSHKTQDYQGEFTNFLSQIFQGIRVVKAYRAEMYEAARSKEMIANIFRYIDKASRAKALNHPVVEVLAGIAIVGIIGYGGYQVMNGNRTTGTFISFIAAFIMAYEPLKRLSNLNANLQEGLAASKRIFSILDLKPVIQNPASSISLSQTIEGRIVFDKVSFAYNKQHMALKNISFTVDPGKTVAFVGPSGAGKSTLINLIPRFYDVSQGKILIDGTDIRALKLNDLRSLIGLVSQEILLFDDTVSHNIAYGDEKMITGRIVQAAKEAAADTFIQKLEEGYNTRIGENGIQLSGGQRQRIAFARAMYKNAPILLLDEATSSLDSESEKRIQTSLRKLMKGRTTLIVAHRLSTIMDADKIYVLENGMIVEEGNHMHLLAKNGLYAQLWQIQSA